MTFIGILLTVVGFLLLVLAVPSPFTFPFINDSMRSLLLIPGSTFFVGGLVLISVQGVRKELQRLRENKGAEQLNDEKPSRRSDLPPWAR